MNMSAADVPPAVKALRRWLQSQDIPNHLGAIVCATCIAQLMHADFKSDDKAISMLLDGLKLITEAELELLKSGKGGQTLVFK